MRKYYVSTYMLHIMMYYVDYFIYGKVVIEIYVHFSDLHFMTPIFLLKPIPYRLESVCR